MKRKMFTTLTILTLLLGVYSSKTKAATLFGDYLKEKDIEVEISADVDFYNKYVCRSFLLDGDPVIQPAVTLSAAGFEGGFWGSWDVNADDALKGDEVDGWISYNFDLGFINEDLGIVGFSVGNTWYGFPEGDSGLADGAHSEEVYVGISVDTLLSPYVTWYYDYGDESSGGAEGYYVMVGGSHSIDLIEDYGVTLDLAFEYGYNKEAFIADDGGYTLTSVGLTIPLTDNVSMSPILAFSSPYGDIGDANDDEFYAGVSTSFSM